MLAPPLQRLLGRGRPQRHRTHVGQPHAHVLDRAVAVLLDQRGHGDHRPVLLAAVELLVAVAVARELREVDRRDDLVLADHRRQVVLEEVRGRDLALARAAADRHRAVGGEQDRRQVGGGVAVGDRAADGPHVADLLVGDRRRRGGDEPEVAGRDVVVAGHRTELDRVAVGRNATQLLDPAQVDQQGRRGEPQLHQRDQRVPAGEDLRVLAAVGQRRQRLVERAGRNVVELSGDQRFASWIASQTRCGPRGMLM